MIDPDNDPYGEHEFGAFYHGGERYFWKIDYYAGGRDFSAGSEAPADPNKTTRVLTIMRADEILSMRPKMKRLPVLCYAVAMTTDPDDTKALARHWLREMAASNAIEGNPFDEKDFALFEQMIEAGLTPEQMVERITAQARADQHRH